MKDPNTGETLSMYSAGSGMLKLTWQNPVTKNATGRQTTSEDYTRFGPPRGFRFDPAKMAYVEGPNVNPSHIGWYDSPDATCPAYDPGSDCPCIVCMEPLTRPMVTVSLAHENPAQRKYSFFFRAHKQCWQDLSDKEHHLIESAVIDATA